MSGVLEVVVGAAGLASLTIQILESIHRLRQLYAAVKHAPDDVNGALVELELLGSVLAEYSSRGSTEVSSDTQNEAVVYCRAALHLLHSIVLELEADLDARSLPWAAIRAAFQRKKLEGLFSKLERAKSTLVLAQLAYLQQKICLGIGTLTAVESHTNKNGDPEHKMEFRFSFAPWFLDFAVAISTIRSARKVQRSLTIYTFIRTNAAIFQACATGDDVLVRQLIDSGKASPLDVTSTGITPLHVAAAFLHPLLCQKLICLGADACASTWGYQRQETPLSMASDKFPPYLLHHLDATLPDNASTPRSTRGRMQDTIRVLVEDGAAEITLFYEPGMQFGRSHSLLHRWQGFDEDFIWLTSEKRINLVGDELEEFFFSIALESCLYYDIEIISLAMSKVSDLSRLAQQTTPWSGWTTLHCLLGHMWIQKHRRPPALPLDAVEKIVDAGTDVHALDWLQRTPLMALAWQGLCCIYYIQLDTIQVRGHCCDPFEEIETAKKHHAQLLDQWLCFLERKKFDLSEYVQREKELGAEMWIEMCEGGWAGCGAAKAKEEWFVRIVFEKSSKERKFKATFEYEVRERKLILPGAWGQDVKAHEEE